MDPIASRPTDADLARAWAAGDERGLEAIVARYGPLVYARCRRALGAADADDATQAVFLVLARKRGQAAATPVLVAWLLTVADQVVRNASRDLRRRRAAERRAPVPQPIAEEPGMDGFREHLDACLARLPAREREAVALHHLAGHSVLEIAASTGAGVSTVKDRLERGLARLRRALGARGVALGAAALLSALQAEAATAVPAAALPGASAAGANAGGAHAAGPSERAQRWSRQPSRAGRLALSGAVIVLVATATARTWIATATATAERAVAVEPAPAPASIPPAAAPTSAWLTVRWNDGARAVARFRDTPEAAMLPAEWAARLDEVASLRDGVLAFALDGLARRAHRFNQVAEDRPDDEAALDRAGDSTENDVSAVAGWLRFTTADAPGMLRVCEHLATGLGDRDMVVEPTTDGWVLHDDGTTVRVVRDGARLRFDSADGSAEPLLTQAGDASDADLEVAMLVQPDAPAPTRIRLTCDANGLRMSGSFPEPPATAPDPRRPAPRLAMDALTSVPGDAFVAGAVALRPDHLRPFLRGLEQGLAAAPEARHAAARERFAVWLDQTLTGGANPALGRALVACCARIDGTLRAWLTPGAPLPVLTLDVELPEAAFAELVAASGLTRNADGTLTLVGRFAVLSLGWADGRLICTSDPRGAAAALATGGFCEQPEIRRALAALPDAERSACLLLRPAALAAWAGPYLAMAVPAQRDRIAAYEERLDADAAYGYLSYGVAADGVRVDAAGVLALVAVGLAAERLAVFPHARN